MAERFPNNLYVVTQEFVIGEDLIDGNNHVNNAKYLELYEAARAGYLRSVYDSELLQLQSRLEGRLFVVDYGGRFSDQVFLGERVSIDTSATDNRRYIQFYQRMRKTNKIAGYFNCTVYLVGENGKMKSFPEDIGDRLNKINLV